MKLSIFLAVLIAILCTSTCLAGGIVKRGIFAPPVPIYPTYYHAPAAVVPPPVSYASVTKYAYPSYPIYKSYYASAPLISKVVYPQPAIVHAAPFLKYHYHPHYHY